MNTTILPFVRTERNTAALRRQKPVQTAELKFAGERKQIKPNIYDDPFMIDFDKPVTPETVKMLRANLLQQAQLKEQAGGTLKVLITTVGGHIESGNRVMDMITQLRVPVDTIIDGGTAASMGGLFFLAGDRRIMTQNAQIMVHPPNVTLPGNIPFSEPDLVRMASNINRARIKGEHYIVKRTGMPLEDAHELMNTETYLDPLKALKIGYATHVLIEDGALTQDSVKGLSDEEIERRDIAQDYDGLEVVDFDPKLPNMQIAQMMMSGMNPAALAAQAQAKKAQGAGKPQAPGSKTDARPNTGVKPETAPTKESEVAAKSDDAREPVIIPLSAASVDDYEITYPVPPQIDFEA